MRLAVLGMVGLAVWWFGLLVFVLYSAYSGGPASGEYSGFAYLVYIALAAFALGHLAIAYGLAGRVKVIVAAALCLAGFELIRLLPFLRMQVSHFAEQPLPMFSMLLRAFFALMVVVGVAYWALLQLNARNRK